MKSNQLDRKIIFIALIVFIGVISSACTITTNPQSKNNDQAVGSSLFVTLDRGENWRAAVAVPGVGGRSGSIANLNVKVLTVDPQDNKAVYLGTYGDGLFYTYDVNSGWNQVKGLPRATINDVKVNPKNKCLIYAAIANRVYRSDDCSRTWSQVYFDNNGSVLVNTIVIDHYNPNNIYIGTSRGEIIKSIDGGFSWRTIQRLNASVVRLVMSPADSRLLFVATAKNNIFSFISNTNTNSQNSADIDNNFLVENWTDFSDALKSFSSGSNFRDLVVSQKDNAIYVASSKVIIRTLDNGASWEQLSLLPSEKDAAINTLEINPNNPDQIYYITNTTFFRSEDGGATWTNKQLPGGRLGQDLLLDFKNGDMIYLGTKNPA